jgi:tRNA dimethylallyltransferase
VPLPGGFRNALILSGPTASGKTRLGLALAERVGAEIIAMDSMTLYRCMDIGTAKPTPDERRRVPHHLIDVLDPWQSASVAWWLERATACARDIEGRGRRVLFVGGTALYLKALLRGLFPGPGADPALRARLEAEAEQHGNQVLHARLARVDPPAAGRLHVNDRRRLVRALEVWELTGRPISQWQQQWSVVGSPPPAEPAAEQGPPATDTPAAYWIDLPREALYARINARVVRMFDEGLVGEVRRLRRLPRAVSREAAQGLGYKEVLDHLDGRVGLEETVLRIQVRSRNFAKRQITWFRHLAECRPLTRELTFSLWGLTID